LCLLVIDVVWVFIDVSELFDNFRSIVEPFCGKSEGGLELGEGLGVVRKLRHAKNDFFKPPSTLVTNFVFGLSQILLTPLPPKVSRNLRTTP